MLTGVNLSMASPDRGVGEKEGEKKHAVKPAVEKTAAQTADELSRLLDWSTAVLVKGSESKKGVGLYQVNLKDGDSTTTATRMILKHAEKAWVLAEIPMNNVDTEQKNIEKMIQVKWNAAGTKVAIHDARPKHSICQVYFLTPKATFERVTLPDAPRWMAARAGVKDKQEVMSSGREPMEWKRDELLFIQFRFRTDDKLLYRRIYPLNIDDKGLYHVQ